MQVEEEHNDGEASDGAQEKWLEFCEAVGCSEKTSKWICENHSSYSSIDTFLDQPELEVLTNKQLKALKSKLQASFTAKHSTIGSKISSVEERIKSDLGLDIQLCQEIVEKWKESDYCLDNLFESEIFEDITKRQQKAIAVILTDEKRHVIHTRTNDNQTIHSYQDKNDEQEAEFLSFIQSVNIKLDENEFNQIMQQAKKQSISTLLEVAGTMELTSVEKLQICVFLFPTGSLEVIEKTVLLQSSEFMQLVKKVNEAVVTLRVNDEAKMWIDVNLFKVTSVDEFENCDSLTPKQLKCLKTEVEDSVANLAALRRSLKKLTARETNGSFERDPPNTAGEDHVAAGSLGASSLSDGEKTNQVLPSATVTFHEDASVEEPRREISPDHLRDQTSQKEDMGSEDQVSSEDETECVDDATGSDSLPAKVLAETFPLITCADQTQGDRVVEQFLVRAEYIKQLCNLKEGCENFYYDISSGLNINFTELSNFELDLVGILGQLDNAKIFFRRILANKSFGKLLRTIKKEGSGMYLIASKSIFSCAKTKAYLYFYSKNDTDYNKADQKSRAVHFVRYITQLTKNIVLLLDAKDAGLLTIKPSNSGKKKTRSQKYNVCELELQKEDVKLNKIGKIRRLSASTYSHIELHSSNSGLYLVASRIERPQTQKIATDRSVSIEDFKKHFTLAEIQDGAPISEKFKAKYIEVYHNDVFQEIEKDVANTKAAFLDGAEDSDLYKIIDFAVTLKFYKTCMPFDYDLMSKYFQGERESSEIEKWKSALQFEISNLYYAISDERRKKIDAAIKDKLQFKNTITKIILQHLLREKKVDLPRSEDFDELYDKACRHSIFGSYYVMKPKLSDASVQNVLMEGMKKIPKDDILSEKLQFLIKKRINLLETLTSDEITHHRDTKNPTFVSSKKELYTKQIQPQVEESKRDAFKAKFLEIEREVRVIQNAKDDRKQGAEETKVIDSIILSTVSPNMRFKIKYTKSEIQETRTILELHKLTLSGSDRENFSRNPDLPLKAEMLTFSNICSIPVSQWEILKIFPVKTGLALLTANSGKYSKVVLYGTSKGQAQLEHDFGKRILQSDFDAANRILCLYSENEETKEMNFYQFDAEYKNFNNYSRIELAARFNFQGVSAMKLQYGSKFIWVLELAGSRILKIHIKTGTVTSSSRLNSLLVEDGPFTDLHMAHNGQCVFLSTAEGTARSVMTETFNVLKDALPSFNGKEVFQLPETNICLAAHLEETYLQFEKLSIQGAQQEMKLQKSSGGVEGPDELATSKNEKHWLFNLYWVFIKFPCEDIFSSRQSKLLITSICCDNTDEQILTRQLNDFLHEMKASLKVTFKPTKLLSDEINMMSLSDFVKKSRDEHVIKMSDFLQKLICFTPLQIARCQANEFLVLRDGFALSTENAQDVFEMKDYIDLGLFEAIFNWWSGNVKVISSMGKQTTGKSYMLNHVMGSSFNISGARCTDGCWMTMNVQEDCLYVILDFEGLGSFERTDQDDMLLSLFNSAISTMTIFKTEHRIDRDTDQLFSKFNLGSDQLKGTGGIFNGSFVIVIKDVAEADLQDIGKEFIEKINNILLKEKQNNFLSKLYKGGFNIHPFPPFQTETFFEEMENLREDIVSADPLFMGGPMFRDTMKLLMAKLAINDFTPLGKQQIEARVKFIRSHLETALHDGVLIVGNDEISNDLTLLDKQNEKVDETWTLTLRDFNIFGVKMRDTNCHFSEDGMNSMVGQYSQYVGITSSNFHSWRDSLEKFIGLCLENRFSRVEHWINGNIEAWKNQDNQEFDDCICSLLDKFNLEKTFLVQKIQFCDSICGKCFLKCTQINGHASAHSCTTNHMCVENCFYCDKDMPLPCKHLFGHENQHVCDKYDHICGQACFFSAVNECPNECILVTNHSGDHQCSLKKHLCKKKCSVEICLGECQLDCSIPHESHKCAKEQCVYECCVENCKNKCSARNHFHGNALLSEKFNREHCIGIQEAPFTAHGEELHIEDHFCGNEHFCGMECQEHGYCEVLVEKTIAKEEVFEGKRSTFKYKRQFVQIGKKLPCLRKILPFQKEHSPAGHCCTLTIKDHLCTEICPTCENICDKPYGHWENEGDEKHHTSHGNMTKCYFICNREDFDVGDHKYKVGEQSVAEFCHMFCSSLGRGHIHVIECPGNCKDEFSVEHDHRRHETCPYGPNEDVPKDEIQHGAYWELIGFEDPCTGETSETFGKCPFYCSAVSHEEEKTNEGQGILYHCELDLWHKPVAKLSDTILTTGTVTKDGHVFSCHHEELSFHWVFALDRSGSMHGDPWWQLQKSTMAFMNSRKELAPEDTYSILLHDHEVHLIEECKTVRDFDGAELSKWCAGGENDFALAISESDKVIGRNLKKSVSPVFIFMSDGIWYNGEKEMEELARKYKTDYKLKIFTIGFGYINFEKLKELARVGGGQYIECPTGIKLESSFLEIASSMPPTVSVTSSK